jgi:23S rRNA pseudouridine955/2504/2580 synthase
MASPEGKKSDVQHLRVTPEHAGRRIDNFLSGLLRDIPRPRVYRMLRQGEVRVNSARVKQDYRLLADDIIRVPPLYDRPKKILKNPPPALLDRLRHAILYEDEVLLAINKPAGMAVHAGSGQQYGIIEVLRALQPHLENLELVHRLDKATSGCLLLSKTPEILRKLHDSLRARRVMKSYTALLQGRLASRQQVISSPLRRDGIRSGERLVRVDETGKPATSRFILERRYAEASLVHVELITGRTHQIRVHAAYMGHPVAGDLKYGNRDFNRRLRQAGLKRMFLHAASLTLVPPHLDQTLVIEAPFPEDLTCFLQDYR